MTRRKGAANNGNQRSRFRIIWVDAFCLVLISYHLPDFEFYRNILSIISCLDSTVYDIFCSSLVRRFFSQGVCLSRCSTPYSFLFLFCTVSSGQHFFHNVCPNRPASLFFRTFDVTYRPVTSKHDPLRAECIKDDIRPWLYSGCQFLGICSVDRGGIFAEFRKGA